MMTTVSAKLTFRVSALLFTLAGVLAQTGVFGGTLHFGTFMYYTIQSNLLAVAYFALLTVRTVRGQSNLPRFGMVCSVNLLVTFIVFWGLLSHMFGASYLLSFENIAVHTVTPLLVLADYILFNKARHLKYRDVYYTCLFPAVYMVFTTIAGLAGYVYYYVSMFEQGLSSWATTTPVRFPYFFLDFDRIGWLAAAYIAGIVAFVLLLGHGMYWIDKKGRKNHDSRR